MMVFSFFAQPSSLFQKREHGQKDNQRIVRYSTTGGWINPLLARWGKGWNVDMSPLSSQEDILYGQVYSL